MAEIQRDKLNPSSTKQKADCPNYFGYYKYLVLNQISQNGDCFSGETEENFAGSKGIKFCDLCGSNPIFTEAIGKGLPDFKKEGLLEILNESVVCLNQEVNEMADRVLATLEIESNQKHVSNAISKEKEDVMTHFNLRKRKSLSLNTKPIGSISSSTRQVYNSIQALTGTDEVSSIDCKKYKHHLLAKLDSMSVNLEEYLNTTVSICSKSKRRAPFAVPCAKAPGRLCAFLRRAPLTIISCRPMTFIEKHQLGKRIRKLPAAAFDRVVEILQPSKISADGSLESITVNLEELDDVKLWWLYYYVELVLKTNKL